MSAGGPAASRDLAAVPSAITDSEIDKLARAIRRRVLRLLRQHGELTEVVAPADDPDLREPSQLQVLGAASVQGRIALGPKAGRRRNTKEDRVAQDDVCTLPRFVECEFRAFLDCGILARGFCRVHCTSCGKDDLVALPLLHHWACFASRKPRKRRPAFGRFSCKGRGFCPSCGTRRMSDTAA